MEALTTSLRCGVLGCADIAWRRMLRVLAAEPGLELTAVASRDEARAARFAREFGCAAVHGYEALLGSADIDAVYVPLPAMLHTEWVEKALCAGKHVLVEKPLAADPGDAERLLRLARSAGLVLRENMAFPQHAQHARVRRELDSGAIGELRDFSSVFTIPPLPEENIRYQPEVGGGALLDLGVYPIRAASHFLGPDVEVVHAVLRLQARTRTVISGRVLACAAGGVTVDLAFGMEHSYRTSCEFAGSGGRLVLERAFTPPTTYQPVLRFERQDHREQIVTRADDQFANVVRSFVDAVRGGAGAAVDHDDASLRQARLVSEVERVARRVTV
ncbi:Gfo/Idh/MocA family protein [Streptomyces oceani]|uniref:Gfo/Idh/MocA family protein n=1 Tax=Streptomyces oceani TaxID=1075402 RepID=UPI000A779BA1|nr:Gfo/Idh/MocA family oxidoreductase [Streptomyces oceani]